MKYFFHSLALVLALIIAASCSRDEAVRLLDAVGDDAMTVIALRPGVLSESMGDWKPAVDDGKLSAASKFEDFLNYYVEGFNDEMMLLVSYNQLQNGPVVYEIADRKKMDKSLWKAGWRKSEIDGFDVFAMPGSKPYRVRYFVIDGNIAWAFRAASVDDAVQELKAIKENSSTPMQGWKKDFLLRQSAVNGLSCQGDFYVEIGVDFTGNKMKAECFMTDENGKPETIWPDSEGSRLSGATAQNLYVGNVLSLAIAPGNYGEWLKRLSMAGVLEVSRSQLALLSSSLEGPVVANVNFNMPIRGVEDIMALICATAKSSATAKLLADQVEKECEYQGLGDFVSVSTAGDLVEIKTNGAVKGSHPNPDEIEGCIIWANVDISPEMLEMLTGVDAFGIKARLSWRDSAIVLEAELPGSSKPFLETLIELANI